MLVLILIIGHLLADFPLQTNSIFERKRESFKGILIHASIHLITYTTLIFISIIINLIEFESALIWYILLITLTHLLIDFGKEKLNKKFGNDNNSFIPISIYIGDQLLHVSVIIGLSVLLFDKYQRIIPQTLEILYINNWSSLGYEIKIALTLITILLNTYFVGYLIGMILKPFKPGNIATETIVEGSFSPSQNEEIFYEQLENINFQERIRRYKTDSQEGLKLKKTISIMQDSPLKTGTWIGMLERNLILLLFLLDSLTSIGFLIAMKSLTRFKQFDDKSFAEFYLIGTMLSIISGLLAGFFLQNLW